MPNNSPALKMKFNDLIYSAPSYHCTIPPITGCCVVILIFILLLGRVSKECRC